MANPPIVRQPARSSAARAARTHPGGGLGSSVDLTTSTHRNGCGGLSRHATHKVATPTRPTTQVLWTPRSTPRGEHGPEMPCRLSPRMERPAGRKAVDQPSGGPHMTAVMRVTALRTAAKQRDSWRVLTPRPRRSQELTRVAAPARPLALVRTTHAALRRVDARLAAVARRLYSPSNPHHRLPANYSLMLTPRLLPFAGNLNL